MTSRRPPKKGPSKSAVPEVAAAAAAAPRGVWGRFKTLFGRSAAAEEAAAPAAPMDGEEDHWVPLTLDSLLSSQPETEVHVVTLRQFRAAIGSTWDRVRQKVLVLAETVLRRFAGPGNLVQRHGEDVFILAFPRLDPAEARKRAFAAAVDLGKRLVGAKFSVVGDPTGASPMIGFATGSGASLLGADGSLDADALGALVDQARDVDTGPAGDSLSGSRRTTTGADVASDARSGGGDDPEWRRLERDDPRAKADVRLVPIDPPKRKKAPEPQWVPIRKP